jgi:Tir chaperone protein (CesT) family
MKTHTQPDWNSLVSEFGRSIGLSEMSLGDTGLCRVELDDCTAIDFETDGVGRLHLYCILPKVSETSRPTLHSAMLEANYSGHREALPVRFAIDPANREELLHFTVPAESAESLETFSTLVSDFSALAHVWCHKSRDLRTATEAPAPIPTPTHSSYA